ncbi:Eco57I restriction-modification methylase domain-containing protein, partial [Reyranella sp.]|uniref:Eco57I restriction-modification methylase domain-containing protein n=1 Tax=Reyranella sp. TaxID=1929291 RepID=UPI003D0EDF99
AYRSRSLKHKARELLDRPQGTAAAPGDAAWRECFGLFQAVDRGNPGWGVPAYNGGLFSGDKAISRAGFELAKLNLPDAAFEPALADLLTIESAEGQKGPVDFRSLGVREFGTIYEGLLESELSVAETDLKLDSNGVYVPARGARDARHVVVHSGEIYLHDKSGARKGSGSYFTKDFVVDYLLDRALEPALTDHLARLEQLHDDTERAREFFDFRVADIAMGSGHFLVAAVDRIERRLLTYLKDRPLPGVRRELDHLRAAARKALGPLADATAIEDGQLLRRLIARRCIYGVDFNPLSVRLAQLAVWIHTFVPGLPLSLLDHSLVHGNSLIGVATTDDIGEVFREAGVGMFAVDASNLLGDAKLPLQKLATIADATRQDVEAARTAMEQARLSILPTAALCDIITARPIALDKAREDVNRFDFKEWTRLKATVQSSRAHHAAKAALTGLAALHFPVAFPEVFLRRRPGFDVILGNPPWEEATVERHAFWARHLPGLRGLVSTAREREIARLERQRPDLKAQLDREIDDAARVRSALMGGGYPGMGKGDPDLYKAFCWRFLALVAAEGGRIGVVLPRSALSAFGSGDFRKSLFGKSHDIEIATLVNNRQWVFPDVHPQYTIGLVAIQRGEPDGKSIGLKGPYASRGAFAAASLDTGHRLSRTEVQTWNDSASLPLLPTAESLDVFLQLRKQPRLDLNDKSSWRARPDTELHATNQKDLMDLKSDTCPKGYWPVFKGESFDLWMPDTGRYYAFADPKEVTSWLYEKRLNSGRRRADSAHAEFEDAYRRDRRTLACYRPRIAFRDVTRATDSRTVRAALLPANVFITNKGPYLLWPRGDEQDAAYLLGVLCSRTLDWFSRRFVEVNLNYFIFNPLPIPRPGRTSKCWERVVKLGGRLACPDDRFADWARVVGVEHGPIADDDKSDMIHELDAVVALLYGLSGKQLSHIFATFHEGWDFEPSLRATLRHFDAWKQRAA